jgi:hypothetical protein
MNSRNPKINFLNLLGLLEMKTGYYVVDSNNKLVFVGTGYNTAIAWRDSLYPYSGVYEYHTTTGDINIDDDSTDGLFWD